MASPFVVMIGSVGDPLSSTISVGKFRMLTRRDEEWNHFLAQIGDRHRLGDQECSGTKCRPHAPSQHGTDAEVQDDHRRGHGRRPSQNQDCTQERDAMEHPVSWPCVSDDGVCHP